MSDMTIIETLNYDEATELLINIRRYCADAERSLAQMRENIIRFEQGQGWRALNYDSLAECFKKELETAFQTGYRQLKAALVEINLRQLSPIGELLITHSIPERHVRSTGIADLPPPQQFEAYSTAITLAKSEGKAEPTENDVKRGVALVKTKDTVFQSPFPIVTHMVVTSVITAEAGREFVNGLNALSTRKQSCMIELMGKFGMTCAALVRPLAGMFDRKPGAESYVLPEVLTGHLGGTPLAKADLRDLARANAEAQAAHISEKTTDDKGAVALVLYKGDLNKSLAVLQKEMGADWLANLGGKLLAL